MLDVGPFVFNSTTATAIHTVKSGIPYLFHGRDLIFLGDLHHLFQLVSLSSRHSPPLKRCSDHILHRLVAECNRRRLPSRLMFQSVETRRGMLAYGIYPTGCSGLVANLASPTSRVREPVASIGGRRPRQNAEIVGPRATCSSVVA